MAVEWKPKVIYRVDPVGRILGKDRPLGAPDFTDLDLMQGYGSITHRARVISRVQELRAHYQQLDPHLSEARFFAILRSLDCLTNSAWYVLARLFELYPDLFAGAGMGASGSSMSSEQSFLRCVSFVPAYVAKLALDRLSGASRPSVTDSAEVGLAMEVIEKLLIHQSRSHQRDVDLTDLVFEMAESLSSADQSSVAPMGGGNLYALTDTVRKLMEFSVEDSVVGLWFSELFRETSADFSMGHGVRTVLMLDETSPDFIDGGDPADILCAMHEAEVRASKGYVSLKSWRTIRRTAKHPATCIHVRHPDWVNEIAQFRPHTDLEAKNLVRLVSRFGAARMSRLPADLSEPPENLPNPVRPCHGIVKRAPRDKVSIQGSIDQYARELAELNTGLPFRVGFWGGSPKRSLPKLFGDLGSWNPKRKGGILNGEIRDILAFCLANPAGLNLLLLDKTDISRIAELLDQIALYSRSDVQRVETSTRLSIPVLMHLKREDRDSTLHFLRTVVWKKHGDKPRFLVPPDAVTLLEIIRKTYGEYQGYPVILLPDSVAQMRVSPAAARNLAESGIACIKGNCASEYQLIVCGALALEVAMKVEALMTQRRLACSVIYLSEPESLYRPEQDNGGCRFVSDQSLGSLFARQTARRLLITDMSADPFVGLRSRIPTCIDIGEPQKPSLYVAESGEKALDAYALEGLEALLSI